MHPREVVGLHPCMLLLSGHWLLSEGFVAVPVLPSEVLCYDGPTYPMQCPIAFGSGLTSTFDLISLSISVARLALVTAANIVRATHWGHNPIQFYVDPLSLWWTGGFVAGLDPVTTFLGGLICCRTLLVPCLALLATVIIWQSWLSTVVLHLVLGISWYVVCLPVLHCILGNAQRTAVLGIAYSFHVSSVLWPTSICGLESCSLPFQVPLYPILIMWMINWAFLCQYCHAGGPFSAAHSAFFGFFVVCLPPISRCHGS